VLVAEQEVVREAYCAIDEMGKRLMVEVKCHHGRIGGERADERPTSPGLGSLSASAAD